MLQTMPQSIGDKFRTAALWTVVLMGFSLPISTAFDSVLLALLLACWAASGDYRGKWSAVRRNAFAVAAAAFFMLHVAGSVYSGGTGSDVAHALGKAATLLMVPIVISLRPGVEWLHRTLAALLIALGVTLVLSYPLWLGWLPEGGILKGHLFDPVVFKKKITQSVLLAYGAFALVLAAHRSNDTKWRMSLWLFAGLAAFNVLFMIWGRTGQLVLASLALYFMVVAYGRRGLAIVLAASLGIGAIAYLTPSSSLHVRVQATLKEYGDWRAGRVDRVANARLEAWTNSVRIVQRHLLIGVGTGGFRAAYAEEVQGTSMPPLDQPENQYVLTTVQLGIVGLVALLALFAVQWRVAARLRGRLETQLARGLVITMVVGCVFNSFLLDHTESFFYALLSGLLIAQFRPATQGGP